MLSAHREKDLRRQELVSRHNDLVEGSASLCVAGTPHTTTARKRQWRPRLVRVSARKSGCKPRLKSCTRSATHTTSGTTTRAELVAATANPGAHAVHSSARSRMNLTNVARNLAFVEDGAAARDRRLARAKELRAQQEEDNEEAAAASQDFAAWFEVNQPTAAAAEEAGMGVADAAAEVGAEAAVEVRQEKRPCANAKRGKRPRKWWLRQPAAPPAATPTPAPAPAPSPRPGQGSCWPRQCATFAAWPRARAHRPRPTVAGSRFEPWTCRRPLLFSPQ